MSNQKAEQPKESEKIILEMTAKQKSISDLVAESCPKIEDGSYDVSNFNFDNAYKSLGLKRVI